MKMKLWIGLVLVALVLGWSGASEATLIQATWTAEIQEIQGGDFSNSIFDVGDEIKCKVLFDNAGTEMHFYNTTGDVVVSTETVEDNPNSDFMSDSQFYFDDKTEAFFAPDAIDFAGGQSFTYGYDGYIGSNYMLMGDYFHVSTTTWRGQMKTSLGEVGSTWTENINFSITKLEFIPVPPGTTIPEPSTILLFGTGLAGLVGSRLRRKKK